MKKIVLLLSEFFKVSWKIILSDEALIYRTKEFVSNAFINVYNLYTKRIVLIFVSFNIIYSTFNFILESIYKGWLVLKLFYGHSLL